jgi:selenocysteine lyase/cysteine desulfurase
LDADRLDIAQYRDRFPIFEHTTYLNSCSQGALADSVRASFDPYLDGLEADGSLWGSWVAKQEEVRGLLARVFATSPEQVAVTPSASTAVSAIASAVLADPARMRVVTTSLEFPTVGQIWHAQERLGAQVVHVPADADQRLPVARVLDAITDDTAMVSVTHVCYRNGSLVDIASIIEGAHDRGVPVLVDSYQAVGAVPIDFEALGADFLVGGALKYMLGVPGVGFALVNGATTSEFVPTTTGWFAARDIFAMDINGYDPAKDARRFEGGTPVVPSLYPVAAGLELLLEVGVDHAWAQSSHLHEALRAGLQELGATVVTPEGAGEHGPMLAVASTDENALVAAMESDRVIVSCRDGNIRVSPHFYNNLQDIERALISFKRHRHLLR